MIPCMDVYKAKFQYEGRIDKLKQIIVFRGDLKNKELVGDTWSPISSMKTLKYVLVDAVNHKSIVNKLYFIGAFLQEKVRIGHL